MVLVIWQLETETREYIPRVGAPIWNIVFSPDTTLWALQCQDNAIRLVNTRSRRLDLAIEGIKAGIYFSFCFYFFFVFMFVHFFIKFDFCLVCSLI